MLVAVVETEVVENVELAEETEEMDDDVLLRRIGALRMATTMRLEVSKNRLAQIWVSHPPVAPNKIKRNCSFILRVSSFWGNDQHAPICILQAFFLCCSYLYATRHYPPPPPKKFHLFFLLVEVTILCS